ncbi:MAG: alpha/beta hydrolase fold domain-containing protein [Tetrasphaera sp.]|nr:alpha/beta hydrolase fold domain-containing protein [Tetrasphaera sp.]
MFVHGGGWAQGNLVNQDSLCIRLAASVGAVVASVDYRMAPETKVPGRHPTESTRPGGWSPMPTLHGVDPARVAACGDLPRQYRRGDLPVLRDRGRPARAGVDLSGDRLHDGVAVDR